MCLINGFSSASHCYFSRQLFSHTFLSSYQWSFCSFKLFLNIQVNREKKLTNSRCTFSKSFNNIYIFFIVESLILDLDICSFIISIYFSRKKFLWFVLILNLLCMSFKLLFIVKACALIILLVCHFIWFTLYLSLLED